MKLSAVAALSALVLVTSTARADGPDAGAPSAPLVEMPNARPADDTPAPLVDTRPEAPPLPPATSSAPPPPASSPKPVIARSTTSFRPNKALLYAGAGLFAAGYLPVVGAALPSTAGLLGRVVIFVGTVGLVPLACALGSGGGYVCSGDHGSIQLLLPIGGPFLYAENHARDTVVNERGRPLSPFVKGALYASGAAQAAGGLLLVGSIALADASDAAGRPVHGKGLFTAGALMFGAGYGAAFLPAIPSLAGAVLTAGGDGNSDHYGAASLAVPVAGPFIYLGVEPRDEVMSPRGRLSETAKVLLAVDGGLQLAGLAAMTAGLVMQSGPDPDEAPRGFAPKLHVAPMLAAQSGAFGLTASLDGW